MLFALLLDSSNANTSARSYSPLPWFFPLSFLEPLQCPSPLVIFGPDSIPLIFLFLFYLGTLLVAMSETLFIFKTVSWKKNLIKKAFLTSISVFLLVRCITLVAPFPYGILGYYLACDQLPRYLIFLGWQMLAIWLGSAVLSEIANNSFWRIWITVFFLVIIILLVCASIILTFLISV